MSESILLSHVVAVKKCTITSNYTKLTLIVTPTQHSGESLGNMTTQNIDENR